MDWSGIIDSAKTEILLAGGIAVAGGLVVWAMAGGYRFVIKAFNRAVGK